MMCRWRIIRIRSFALIELLVVIVIIIVLIAILLPALSTARDRAVIVSCGNNFKQIGVGFVIYADDNNGLLPMPLVYRNVMYGTAVLADYGTGQGGFGKLIDAGIITNRKVFVCPARSDWTSTWWSPYTMRLEPPAPWPNPPVTNENWFHNPIKWRIPTSGVYWLASDCYFEHNHGDKGINILLCDGHVQFERLIPDSYALMNLLYDRHW